MSKTKYTEDEYSNPVRDRKILMAIRKMATQKLGLEKADFDSIDCMSSTVFNNIYLPFYDLTQTLLMEEEVDLTGFVHRVRSAFQSACAGMHRKRIRRRR